MKNINIVREKLKEIDALVSDHPFDERTGNKDGVITFVYQPSPSENNKNFQEDGYLKFNNHEKSNEDLIEDLYDLDPMIEIGAEIDDKLKILGEDNSTVIKQNINEQGVDALGYYRSFHITGRQWGVFIKVSGLRYLYSMFKIIGMPEAQACKNAFQLILNHELFHFATDFMISQLELCFGEPLWLPIANTCLEIKPNYILNEEKMANAYMLRRARSGKNQLKYKGKLECLKSFIKEQPPGYANALQVRYANFDSNLNSLGLELLNLAIKGGAKVRNYCTTEAFDWINNFQIKPMVDWRYCPIILVDDNLERLDFNPEWVSCFGQIQDIIETNKFKKMLKKLPEIIQRKWIKTKRSLSLGIKTGDDFKKWTKAGDSTYSVRVDISYRAHLHYSKAESLWEAIEIGNHKELGHG